MKTLVLVVFASSLMAQVAALTERVLADQMATLKTDDRVSVYRALIEAKPENLRYHNLLAATYIQKTRETTDFGYLDRASKLIASVLDADSSNYEALRLRSEVELERHNFKLVAEYSRALVKIAPNDPWNWGTLGDALIELGDYDGAADAYQKMINLRPDLSSYNRAAHFRFLSGDLPGAIELMERAIKAGSHSEEHVAWCMVELGNLYFRGGRIEESLKAHTSALRTFPGYHPAYAGLARAQAAKGELTPAIENYRKAQSITPLPEYAAALFVLYEVSGNKSEAGKQKDLIGVIDKIGPGDRSLAMIYSDLDWNPRRALDLAQAEMSVRKDVYTHDALAWAYYKNGRFAEAEAASAEALKLATPEPMFHYHAGMIAAALGKKAAAAKHLKRAIELNSRFDLRQAAIAAKTLESL